MNNGCRTERLHIALMCALALWPGAAVAQDAAAPAGDPAEEFAALVEARLAGDAVDTARLDALKDELARTEGRLPYGFVPGVEGLDGEVVIERMAPIAFDCVRQTSATGPLDLRPPNTTTYFDMTVFGDASEGEGNATSVSEGEAARETTGSAGDGEGAVSEEAAEAGTSAGEDAGGGPRSVVRVTEGEDGTAVLEAVQVDGALVTTALTVSDARGEFTVRRNSQGGYDIEGADETIAPGGPEAAAFDAMGETLGLTYPHILAGPRTLSVGEPYLEEGLDRALGSLLTRLAAPLSDAPVTLDFAELVLSGRLTAPGSEALVFEGTARGTADTEPLAVEIMLTQAKVQDAATGIVLRDEVSAVIEVGAETVRVSEVATCEPAI